MSSKLKVALSKFSQLPLLESLTARYSAMDPRSAAHKFYCKTLPKMMTIPKRIDSLPKVNVWLWMVGYLKLQWPNVEKNLVESKKKLFSGKHPQLFMDLDKYLHKAKNLKPIKLMFKETSNPNDVKK